MNAVIERRVDNLEVLMAELIQSGKAANEQHQRTEACLAAYITRSEQEMREFKQEMRALSTQADERLDAHIAHSEQQLAKLSQSLDAVSQRLDKTRQESRKEIGEIANRIGRLVEDIVHPSIPKIFTEITGLAETAINESSIRAKRKYPSQREFDAVIVSAEYVLINETKSTLRPEDVQKFYGVMKEQIRAYFPAYTDKKFIGVVSSLYVDVSIVTQGAKLGLYVLGFKEDLMDVLNPMDFKPRYF